jgi:hypothetical protein
MLGAREYSGLFKNYEQHGRMVISHGSHARGETLEIFIIPKSYGIIDLDKLHMVNNKVEIYGLISGYRGWSERYGWLHEGPWVVDFEKIVKQKRVEI